MFEGNENNETTLKTGPVIPQNGNNRAEESSQTAEKRDNRLRRLSKNPLVIGALLILVLAGLYFGFNAWQLAQSRVYIENSEISAPVISIGSELPGVLQEVFVKEGETVSAGQALFNIDGRIIRAKTSGLVTSVQNVPGQMVTGQSAIVQMYDPASLRVIGHIQEDQGLSSIQIGQRVIFTVDAFGSKQYTGTVENIGTLADQSNLVFSISDKRQEKMFAVTVAFYSSDYPELTNGMSAKMWVYK
jgi:multidrug resistance efflux pump